MIVQYSITGTAWTAISTAGQSGVCFLDEQDDGAGGSMDVRVFHTTGTPVDDDLTKGKRVYRPVKNDDLLPCSADSTTDIYYARCKNTTDTATISADFV